MTLWGHTCSITVNVIGKPTCFTKGPVWYEKWQVKYFHKLCVLSMFLTSLIV